ncbi:N5-carboxyaminoimidazole ribonucleotide mutase [Candidatus Providencia siddallii]|uniref:N5-carboxyaminoimidazole ribonucleotide mutase n=2 Tax=Candidatus Providencia siddallii TaxID=1715285 RepID=A0ABP1CE07_9GAMM
MIIQNHNIQSKPKIAIVMGSKKDWITMQYSANILTELQLTFHVEIISAHRTPNKLFSFAENSKKNGFHIIIAGAGGAAHLPGMLASKTLLPVLGVPIQSTALNGIDSLYSILQMPKGIPVGTLAIGVSGAVNASLLAAQILAINDMSIFNKLSIWRKSQTNDILNNPDPRIIK